MKLSDLVPRAFGIKVTAAMDRAAKRVGDASMAVAGALLGTTVAQEALERLA